MAKKYFVPQKDGNLRTWLANIRSKISSYAATLGLTGGDVTNIQNACDDMATEIQNVALAKVAYKAAVAKKKAQRKKTVSTLTRYFRFVKATVNYNDSIGKDLGIVGSETTFDKGTFKPKLRARVHSGYVDIDYNKSKTDGIRMWSKLENEADDKWVELGLDVHPPFIDKRPLAVAGQAEARQYRAMAVLNDELIGQWSDIITVAFAG